MAVSLLRVKARVLNSGITWSGPSILSYYTLPNFAPVTLASLLLLKYKVFPVQGLSTWLELSFSDILMAGSLISFGSFI